MSVDLSKYKMLSDIEHVLLRAERDLGTMSVEPYDDWVITKNENDNSICHKSIKYSIGFLKIFSEIVDNSCDESKRDSGKHMTRIDITIDKIFNTIIVKDDGGIPVIQHPETGLWIPDQLFGYLRSGSNFDTDEVALIGTNGLGSTLANIMSSEFVVQTSDGKNSFKITYKNNLSQRSEPEIKKSKSKGTSIFYTPDLHRFGMETIDSDTIEMIYRRVWIAAVLNPNLQFYFNNKEIKSGNFESFCNMGDSEVFFDSECLQVGIAPATDGFFNYSFVNGTNTTGGTHVNVVMDQVVSFIREHIKKKTKQDLKPLDIKNRITLFLNCDVVTKRFSSQMKTVLTSSVNELGHSFELDEKFLKKLLKTSVVSKIIDWALRKQESQDAAELAKANKDLAKSSLRNIPKFENAVSKDRSKCQLFLSEGDSALNPILACRDPMFQGAFPLRGKPLSVYGKSLTKVKENAELTNMAKILGVEFGKKVDFDKLNFGQICLASDADADGHSIFGLMVSNLYILWPELVTSGKIYRLQTPIIRVVQGKNEYEFMTESEFDDWENKQKSQNYKVDYLKGIGSNTSKQFKKYLSDPKYIEQLKWEEGDFEYLKLAFDPKLADNRKEWLQGEQHNDL